MVILGRILVFFGLVAILHAGYSAVQCEYFVLKEKLSKIKHTIFTPTLLFIMEQM